MSIAQEVQNRADPKLLEELERILANKHALRLGATGDAVREVNRRLGFGEDKTVYDHSTEERTEKLQRAFYLKDDGVTGRATLGALLNKLRDVQSKLGLVPDGIFRPDEFEAATRAFQARHKLTVDGVVGPQTFAKLAESPALTPAFASRLERSVRHTVAEPDALPKPPTLETIQAEREQRAKAAALPKLEKKEELPVATAKPTPEQEHKKPAEKKAKEKEQGVQVSEAGMFSLSPIKEAWNSFLRGSEYRGDAAAQGNSRRTSQPDHSDLLINPSRISNSIEVLKRGKRVTIELAPIGNLRDGGVGLMQTEAAVAYTLLNKEFKKLHGYELPLEDAWRSNEEQRKKKYGRHTDIGTRSRAAKPGYSDHESGLSVDISQSADGGTAHRWLHRQGREFGFIHDAKPSDPYHFTYHADRASRSGRAQIQTELGKITRAQREQGDK